MHQVRLQSGVVGMNGSWTQWVSASVLAVAGCADPVEWDAGGSRDAPARQEALTGLVEVDDDGNDCPTAAFHTIQAAVDAANPGDTILVCAGRYAENVYVGMPLRLLGARHGQDGRTRGEHASQETQVISARPFQLDADDVVLDGFSIRVAEVDGEGFGVETSNDHTGFQILNNLLDASNVTALFAGSSGETPNVVRHNLFRNRLGVVGFHGDFLAIARNLVVDSNTFADSSIAFSGAGHRDIQIINNAFVGNSTVSISGVQGALVEGNAFSAGPQDAVVVAQSDRVVVRNNVMQDAP